MIKQAVIWGIIFGIVHGSLTNCKAQKSDYNWLSGYDSKNGYQPSFGFYFGTSIMDFNQEPRKIYYDSLGMNFDETNTSFSDSDGNLLFYSNGIYIANSLDEIIENSDTLNPGYMLFDVYPDMLQYGYRNPSGIYAVENESKSNQYYIIYSYDDSFGYTLTGREIMVALLDMSANNGHGKVIYKNQAVITDTLSIEVAMTRHGNGRDWWAVVQKRNTNCYYSILVDKDGVHALPVLSCGSEILPVADYGAACFSPDGSKYVYLSATKGINIFDFDRCSGQLSNPINMPLPSIDSFEWYGRGIAISPNNRFLYVSLTVQLYQFDLEAMDVFGSIDTVGFFDGTNAPFLAVFNTAQLGPDGKIYISCGNADTVYHVINSPDLKGDSCNFQQHGIQLPSPSWGVPSFPNYRLGALTGSGCDTLSGLSEVARAAKEAILKVYPNPATTDVTIDYGFTDWSKTGAVSLEISNELGQVVYKQTLPQYSGYQKLDVSKFAAGVYVAFIKRNEMVVAVQKFGKE